MTGGPVGAGRQRMISGSRWHRGPLATVATLALLATALTGVAVVEAQSAFAAGTFWAAPDGSGDCTQTSPCSISDGVGALNAAGGGTLELSGDPNTPYTNFRADGLVVPATIEAAPGATPVLRGFGSEPVLSSSKALTVRGLDILGGTFGVFGSGVGTVTIVNSYIHNNSGPGVTAGDVLTIRNSTIAFNGGDGVNDDDPGPDVRIISSSIYANGSTGVFVANPQLISSTIVDNGLNLDVGSLTAAGSIIAGSSPNCITNGFLTDAGGNISDDATCGLTAGSSVQNSATIVGSLKAPDFNGGTPTIGLSAGSPAIGLVPGTVTGNGSVVCAQPDQRGLPRPSSACDAGAYQSGNTMIVTMTAPSPTITYGDEIPYFSPADPTGTRLRVAASCTSTADYAAQAGTYPITCSGAAASPDVTFNYVAGTLTVNKAPMTITASSEPMSQGGPVPTITPVYDDYQWVNGDTPDVIDTPPTCSTTATADSDLGNYPSTCSGAVDNSYTFTYVDGTVTVADTTPPVATIDSGPSGLIATSTATFTFESNEPGSFLCMLQGPSGTAWLACTSPRTYSGLRDGSYTFYVGAYDQAGNSSLTVGRSFTVDTTPPDTTITSGPSGTITDANPTFGFTANQAGSTFECELDGPGGAVGSFASCTSPTGFTGLDDGDYTFSVRATDAAGNTDPTPATRSFTVDATPPDTTIDAGPSGLINTAAATFGFSADQVGSTFECELDGPGGATGDFASCSSPQAYNGLADGSYTFSVRAINAAGKPDLTPASRSFTVDTTPPDTTIDAGPSGLINTAAATFGFSADQAGSTFECKLDGAGGAVGSFASCTSPTGYANLADGNYTFSVRATDAAGNTDPTPASRSFTVDTTPPDTTIDSGPSQVGNDATPTFGFSASEAGSSFTCSVDGANFTPCTSPVTVAALKDGTHTFAVRATDAAGNTDPTPASRSFTVDTTPPVITLVTPTDGASYGQDAVVAAQYSCADTAGGSGIASCTGTVASGAPIATSVAGLHGFTVDATDNAGNPATVTVIYVVRAKQSISWSQQGPYAYGQAPVTLTASATSGLAVSYAVTSGPCSVAGSTLTVTGVGVCKLTAAQSGNAQYLPAPVVSQSITINRAPTKLVAAPAKVTLLRATFSATLTSTVTGRPIAGQTVTFTAGQRTCSATTNSSGVATCFVNGIFFVFGRLSYTATYAGNADYLPTTATG